MRLQRLDDAHIVADRASFYNDLSEAGAWSMDTMYRFDMQRLRFERVVQIMRRLARPGYAALEIGCAEGLMTQQYATYYQHVDAMDISTVAIGRAPELQGVEYYVGDVETWEPPRDRYNVILMSEVLEHVPDAPGVIRRYAPRCDWLVATMPITEQPNVEGAFDIERLHNETVQADATGHIWYMDFEGFCRLFTGLRVSRFERHYDTGIAILGEDYIS